MLNLVIVMPVFNDWDALLVVLGALDGALAPHAVTADVLIVDDGSTEP
ncbi:MAG: glycosyl transferase, partial [Chloroflexi bacterium]|nr:glycosyl transferase [Chloroflexota bacterium]